MKQSNAVSEGRGVRLQERPLDGGAEAAGCRTLHWFGS